MAACRAACLCGTVKPGRTALGIVGGSKGDNSRSASAKMSRGFSAGARMTGIAIAVDTGQGIVNRVCTVTVGILVPGRIPTVRRPVVAGGAMGQR